MTVLELIDRVLSKLGEPAMIIGPEIEAALPTCLNRFADSVAADPKLRELLSKNFVITLASGVGNLTTAFTATEPLIIEQMEQADVTHTSSTLPLQPLPDITSLRLPHSKMVIYYTVHGQELHTRNTDGSLTSLTGSVNIHGSYVPSLADVPAQLKDMFVDVVVGYLNEGLQPK